MTASPMTALPTTALPPTAPSATAPKPPAGTFLSVQYLRGAAALIVMVFHIFSNRIAAPFAGTSGVALGMWGVDIFFVLSGFIMWRTAGEGVPAGRFLLRRAVRILPLYWLFLTLWIGLRLAVPDGLGNADVTPSTLVFSYLLIPHHHAVFGAVWPILTVGWTLQLELFFYAVFAALLCAVPPGPRLPALMAALAALAGLGYLLAPGNPVGLTYTSPLLLEFLGGIALGAMVGRLSAMPRSLALALVAGGIAAAALLAGYGENDALRPLALGLPAVAVVAGLLGCERALREKPNRTLLALGDASYALYLAHPLAIAAAAVVWRRLGLPVTGEAALAFVPAAALVAVAVALVAHRAVERPLLRLMPERRKRSGFAAAQTALRAPRPADPFSSPGAAGARRQTP